MPNPTPPSRLRWSILLLIALLLALVLAVGIPATSKAAPNGCETIRWGFLGSERRTVCDGPVQPDGTWQRTRTFWTPAYRVPAQCSTYGGLYYANTTCYPARLVSERLIGTETYPVTNQTVLPDEPGHLPAGTDVLR